MVKGFIILKLLISVVRPSALVKPYSANFLIKQFCAVLFTLAFLVTEFWIYLERCLGYYAARRSV
ncbi:MAG: hypothetical protein CL688_00910 [Candidatus Puniceispirillum sp.]|nr:hypothetical protein [Candidatus Puniceispirillum sp.]